MHMCDIIQVCDMTPAHVWHESFICVVWLIQMCDMTEDVCGMTHEYV